MSWRILKIFVKNRNIKKSVKINIFNKIVFCVQIKVEDLINYLHFIYLNVKLILKLLILDFNIE